MVQIQLRNVRNWKHECKFFSKKIVLIGFLLFKFQKYSKEFHPLKFPLEGRKGGWGGCGIQHPQNPSSLSQNPYFDHCLSYTIRASRCFFTHTAWKVSVFSVFSLLSGIWTEYGEILCMSLNSVWMRENMDQKNSEYGHFSRSDSSVANIRRFLR